MHERQGPRPDWLDGVRATVAALLAEGLPTVGAVAARLDCRVRTLQRRLRLEGTSFSALLEDVRRERALEGLGDRELPLGALSASLGYSRQSALTRAVRRWTGAAPRQLRNDRGR
jgi:AraC-like DNA-binding protein